jgi:hypothetical protein
MNPPSENHSTVTDDTQDWMVEKSNWAKSKLSAALRWQPMIREMTRSRFLARDVASVMMLCSVPTARASSKCFNTDRAGRRVPDADELRGVAGNSRDQDLPRGSFTSSNYGLPDVKGPESHRNEFRQCSRLSCSEKLSRRKRLDYR